MGDIQTTGRRREVGAALKRIRQELGWPAYRLAERLDWTPSHISRSEAGKRKVTDVDAGYYLGMCGAPNGEVQEVLKAIREPDDYRLQRHEGRVPDELRTLMFHENTATEIYTVEPSFIPGPTQTADYARALFEEGGIVDPSRIDDLVKIRTSRSAAFSRPKPSRRVYFVHENALRAPVGGSRVMNEQLLNLLFLGQRPHCPIRVIPASAGVRGMTVGSFQIFNYKEDPSIVYLEHETTSEFLETEDEVAHYSRILNRVATVALDGAQSREFLAALASDYERQGDAQGEAGGLAEE
jgi:transcriptional regulator with XRE-family HTH domain